MGADEIRALAGQTKTAGGWSWDTFLKGTNPDKLFKDAQREDRNQTGSDPYSGTFKQCYGYSLRTRTPMSITEAHAIAEKDLDRMDTGDCKAIPIAEERLLGREKEVTVRVTATDRDKAIEAAKAKARTLVTVRQGAKFIVEITSWPRKVKGDMPTMTKEPSNLKGYVILKTWRGEGWGQPLNVGRKVVHENKAKANAALREYLGSLESFERGVTYTFIRVEGTETISLSGGGGAATWDVGIKYRQVKMGKVIGYYFYGWARS